jgi:Tat protein translocase TatB subunit
MFNIGPAELIVILLVALLVVGPKRLPEVGKSVGKALREIRRQTDEVRSTFDMNLDDDDEQEPVRDVTGDTPALGAGDDADHGWDASKWSTEEEQPAAPDDAGVDATGPVEPEAAETGEPAAAEAGVAETAEAAAAEATPAEAATGRRRRTTRDHGPAHDGPGPSDPS